MAATVTTRPIDPRVGFTGLGEGRSRPASTLGKPLATLQGRYPHLTSLNDELDWMVLQDVVNQSLSPGSPVTTVRRGLAPVVIPPGRWVLNQPLAVTSAIDFNLRGEGGATELWCAGAGMTSVLDLNGTAYSSFSDFHISNTFTPASHSCTRALWVRWDNAVAARSSTLNRFANIVVRNVRFTRAGIEIGLPGSGLQEDNTTWHAVSVSGDPRWHVAAGTDPTADAWIVGTGVHANNLIHAFTGCSAIRARYGLNVSASEACWTGGSIQTMTGADIYGDTAGFVNVTGVRSEHSARLLATGGPAGIPAKVSIANYDFASVPANLATDRRIIQWYLGGCLDLRNITVTNPSNDPITIYAAPPSPAAIHSTGVTLHQRTMAQAYDLHGAVTNVVHSYITTNAAGDAIAVETN